MQFGSYQVSLHNHGFFRLDGGAMFGVVPKNMWGRMVKADQDNCIVLATRSLLIQDEHRKILVDVGTGNKWNEKQQGIYAFQHTPEDDLGFKKESITDIIISHLHFDHAGGLSCYNESKNLVPAYPQATVHLQKDNYENARKPSVREKASYLKEHVGILEEVELNLVEGSVEVFPSLWVHQSNGHTRGQQHIELRTGQQSLYYAADLIPTSHHLRIPYNMGYDICTETLLKEKEALLNKVLEQDAILVFEHDTKVEAVKIDRNDKGHIVIKEQIDFT